MKSPFLSSAQSLWGLLIPTVLDVRPTSKYFLDLVTARQRSWGKVMFSVLCVCQSVCPGEGMGLLMRPLPTMHWTSLYRHETWDHPPHYYHLVAITDDLFKIVHSRTPTHRYWYLVALPPKHTRLASGWYASYYFLVTVRNIVAARLFSQASVTLFTGGCIPACTGADTPWEDTPGQTPPSQADTPPMATAADGMHPTGIHSC